MGNAQRNACQQLFKFVTQSLRPQTGYNVFINHRGIDVKETIASLIYHNLYNKGYDVFLDKKSIQAGNRIPKSIDHAIRTASVHVAIFSPNYAESEWCLDELDLMLKTGAPIVPVFGEIQSSQLHMEEEDGVYGRAFQLHKINPQTLDELRKALSEVPHILGYIFKGDQGELLEQIAMCVTKYIHTASKPRKLAWTGTLSSSKYFESVC